MMFSARLGIALSLMLVLCAASPKTHSQPVVYNGNKNLVISGQHFSNPNGDCLELNNVINVTIIDSDFNDCYSVAIRITGGSGFTIGKPQHWNTIEHMGGGVYAVTAKNVNTQFLRCDDVHKDWGDPSRGQCIQYNQVTGGSIHDISAVNEVGSNPEDEISVFQSSGVSATQPLTVYDICIENPLGAATSGSGSGLMLGDGGGGFIDAHGITLINPGQVGIGVAGGHDISVMNYQIYGAQDAETNVGVYVWDQSNSGQCKNIWVGHGSVDFTRSDGVANPAWDAGNCQGTSWNPMWTSNDLSATLSGLHCPAFNGH